MRRTNITIAVLALAAALGCSGGERLRGGPVGKIDYALFDLDTVKQPDGSVVLHFRYTGDTTLHEVALFPVLIHNDGWHWQVHPIPFPEWKPNQTITLRTDEEYRTRGHARLRDVKLVLRARRNDEIVYVTKKFPNEGADPPEAKQGKRSPEG